MNHSSNIIVLDYECLVGAEDFELSPSPWWCSLLEAASVNCGGRAYVGVLHVVPAKYQSGRRFSGSFWSQQSVGEHR
jgi:hypothetical protein